MTAYAKPTLIGFDMPEKHGARFDAVENITLQTTAGSNILTCTNAPFTPADTGKLAWALGAGANAQHLTGYLLYQTSTTCQLLQTPGGAARNAVTTVSKNGTLRYGTDDAVAIEATWAACKAGGHALNFGERKYMTSGTLTDGGDQLDIYGAGRKRCTIYCTNPLGFYNANSAALQRAHIHDFTVKAVKHVFADLRAQANASGFQNRLWERLEIMDYTGCGWQNNTTDGPYEKLRDVNLVGWDEIETIGAAFGQNGLADSSTLDSVAIGGAHRVGIKVSRGGPNFGIEGNNGFVNGVSASIAVINDAAMTNGGFTVTSATDGRFDSTMVGLAVTVSQATSAKGALQSSIKSVDSPTQVTLYNPAGNTVSGVNMTIRAKQRPYRTVNDFAVSAIVAPTPAQPLGQCTITSATAAFTNGDLASGINVVGAGQPGVGANAGELNARIIQVVNATTVIANVAAYTTVSGAFGAIAAPQIKLQIEPSPSVNAGLGFSCDNQKFGSELLRPGDIHVAICESELIRTTNTASMTAGSATLTDSSVVFTPDMANTRYVTVTGVGQNGGTISCRVIAYISATQVTLDTAASTTASSQNLTLAKASGERMPVLDTPSTGTLAQSGFTSNIFSNAGNGANGDVVAPFYSTTPLLQGLALGPNNVEQGSGYLAHVEFGPGVTATPNMFSQTSLVYPMLDNNAGRSRRSPIISTLPGMVAKQLSDPSQVSGVRVPSISVRQSSRSMSLIHLLKTRMSGFTPGANAAKISNLSDTEMGTDACEWQYTAAGSVSATLLQADVASVIGEPVHITFDIAPGSSGAVLDHLQVLVRYPGSTVHFQEYIDVPTRQETIELAWIPQEASGNLSFVFQSDGAGYVKLGEPAVYRNRAPVNLFRRDWLSPNGTVFKERIDDTGLLQGVTATPPASFSGGYDVVVGARGSGAVAAAAWQANFQCVFVRLWGSSTISNLLFLPTTLSGNYLVGLYANSGSGRSAVPTGNAILSTASAPMSGLTANALATVALGGSQAITPGSHWGMLAIDNTTAQVARETVLNATMSAAFARQQTPGSLLAPAPATGTALVTFWPWMQAT